MFQLLNTRQYPTK